MRLDLDDLGGEVCLVDFSDHKNPLPTLSRFRDLDAMVADVRERSLEHVNSVDGSVSGLIQGVLTKRDVAYIKTVFDVVDTDGGGTINKDEFHAMFRNMCKEAKIKCPSATVIDRVFAKGALRGNGEINWNEWVSLYAKVKLGEVDCLGDILQSSNLVPLQQVPLCVCVYVVVHVRACDSEFLWES